MRVNEWEAEVQMRIEAFRKQREKFKEYFALHRIWLPDDLNTAAEELVAQYNEHSMRVQKALEEWFALETLPTDTEKVNQDLDSYDDKVRKTRDWFNGDRLSREKALWSIAREILVVVVQDANRA